MKLEYNVDYDGLILNEETNTISAITVDVYDYDYKDLSNCTIKTTGNFTCRLDDSGLIIVENPLNAEEISGYIVLTDNSRRFCGDFTASIYIDASSEAFKEEKVLEEENLWSTCTLEVSLNDEEIEEEVVVDAFGGAVTLSVLSTDEKGNKTTFTLSSDTFVDDVLEVYTDNKSYISLKIKNSIKQDVIESGNIIVTNSKCDNVTKTLTIKAKNIESLYDSSLFYVDKLLQKSTYIIDEKDREFGVEEIIWESNPKDNQYITLLSVLFKENKGLDDSVSGFSTSNLATIGDKEILEGHVILDYDNQTQITFSTKNFILKTGENLDVIKYTQYSNYILLSLKNEIDFDVYPHNGSLIFENEDNKKNITINFEVDNDVLEIKSQLYAEGEYINDDEIIFKDGIAELNIISKSHNRSKPFYILEAKVQDEEYDIFDSNGERIYNINNWVSDDLNGGGLGEKLTLKDDNDYKVTTYGVFTIFQADTHISKTYTTSHIVKYDLSGSTNVEKYTLIAERIDNGAIFTSAYTTSDFVCNLQDGNYFITIHPEEDTPPINFDLQFKDFEGDAYIDVPYSGDSELTIEYTATCYKAFDYTFEVNLTQNLYLPELIDVFTEDEITIQPCFGNVISYRKFNDKYLRWVYANENDTDETVLKQYGNTGLQPIVMNNTENEFIVKVNQITWFNEQFDEVFFEYNGYKIEYPTLVIRQEGLPIATPEEVKVNFHLSQKMAIEETLYQQEVDKNSLPNESSWEEVETNISENSDSIWIPSIQEGDIWGRDLDEPDGNCTYYHYKIKGLPPASAKAFTNLEVYGVSAVTDMCIDEQGNSGTVATYQISGTNIIPPIEFTNYYLKHEGHKFTPTNKYIYINYKATGVIMNEGQQYNIYPYLLETESYYDEEEEEEIIKYSLESGITSGNSIENITIDHSEYEGIILSADTRNFWKDEHDVKFQDVFEKLSDNFLRIDINDVNYKDPHEDRYEPYSGILNSTYEYSIGLVTRDSYTHHFYSEFAKYKPTYECMYFSNIIANSEWVELVSRNDDVINIKTNFPVEVKEIHFFASSSSAINAPQENLGIGQNNVKEEDGYYTVDLGFMTTEHLNEYIHFIVGGSHIVLTFNNDLKKNSNFFNIPLSELTVNTSTNDKELDEEENDEETNQENE